MNQNTRSLRAVIAVMLLLAVAMLTADALGHTRVGAEYNYSLYAVISIALGAVAVALFAWNVVQYAVKRNR